MVIGKNHSRAVSRQLGSFWRLPALILLMGATQCLISTTGMNGVAPRVFGEAGRLQQK